MARVADTETAMRTAEAARYNEQLRPGACIVATKLCCSALPLGLVVYCILMIVMFVGELKNLRYERPEFNLTSLNASQPSALVLGDKVVVAGWVACFSTRNPNPNPISYHQVTALLWAHRGRQFDLADVAAFEQAPAVAAVVCASFPGDAVVETESDDKTVWFDAVRLNANVTYKSDDEVRLHVVCEDVKVLVYGDERAVATELDGGAQECRVKTRSSFAVEEIVGMVLYVILGVVSLVAYGECVRRCFFRKDS